MTLASPPEPSPLTRRSVVLGGGALAGLAGLGALSAPVAAGRSAGRSAGPVAAGRSRAYPFTLGVASGDPLPDGVILWTRLAPDPLNGGGMPARRVAVRWEVATDERFRRVVRRGVAVATPELAHSVHVDVRGLRPGRDHFYRFRAGAEISPVGRTRTAPRAGSSPAQVRFAVASCQDWQNGYWPAYTGMAAEDLDLVLHLGDYIYEYDPDPAAVRTHTTPEQPGLDQLRTLADYRNRHAQYKTDPALQAAHAAFPWVVTWDDHETENNYAGLVDEETAGASAQDPVAFAAQRAAAYQAYYEHMPIRAPYTVGSPDFLIYRRFDLGTLARLNVLDTRQYRTDQPCGAPGDFGPVACGEGNATGTLVGGTQEQWLRDGLAGSGTRWNVIAQQVMAARTLFTAPVVGPLANLDQWDGYAPARTRLLSFLAEAAVANPVVLAGDIHSSWVNDLRPDFDDPSSPVVATEFVASSISSDFPAALIPVVLASNASLNPHVRFFDGLFRGYLRCTVEADIWRTDVRFVPSIASPTAPVGTLRSFVVEAGAPGVLTA